MIGSIPASGTGTPAVTPEAPAPALTRDAWWPRWRAPVLAWAASRVLVIGLAVLTELWLGPTSLSNDRSVPGPLTLLGSWDTSWYIDIARHGYDHNTGLVGVVMTNLAFFPLLPAVMWLGLKTATNPFLWGFVVSNLAFFGAVLGFHRLTWDRRGLAFANRATWVFALAPPAIYASLAYTDGILVALAVGAAPGGVARSLVSGGARRRTGVVDTPAGHLHRGAGRDDRAARDRHVLEAAHPPRAWSDRFRRS